MKDLVDRELERRFADLVRSDEETAPGFERVLGRGSVRVRAHSLVPALARAAAVAAALSIAALMSVLWIRRSRRAEEPAFSIASATASITDWKSPTSVLLETPGLDLLQSTPALATPADAPSESSPPTTPVPPRSRRLPPKSKGASS